MWLALVSASEATSSICWNPGAIAFYCPSLPRSALNSALRWRCCHAVGAEAFGSEGFHRMATKRWLAKLLWACTHRVAARHPSWKALGTSFLRTQICTHDGKEIEVDSVWSVLGLSPSVSLRLHLSISLWLSFPSSFPLQPW